MHTSKFNFVKSAFILATLVLTSLTVSAQTLLFVKGASITVQTGDTIYVQGGMTMTNNADIVLNGAIVLANTSAVSNTPWYDSTSTGSVDVSSTGNVIFTNKNNQILYGPTRFANLEFNTPSTINLSNDMTVTGTLKLTQGVVNTNGNKIIVTSTAGNAIVAGAGNTNYTQSWINGNLRRYMATNTSSYDFPVGNSTQANLATLSNHNLNGITYIDASFGAKPGTDLGLNVSDNGTGYMDINTAGVWVIEPNQQPVAGSYDMACYFNGFSGLIDNQFGLVKRPATSTNAADWTTGGGTMNASNGLGRTVAGGYALRNGLTSFSQFGIAIATHSLPVTLVSFDATPDNNTVHTAWVVASQHNNHLFNVQRSADGENFTTVGTLEGAGTSNKTMDYTFNDESPLAGTSYYRLQQVDFDGAFAYSQAVAVNMEAIVSQMSAKLYPNPAQSNVNLDITNTQAGDATVTIIDMAGNMVSNTNVSLTAGANHINLNVNTLNAGVYMVNINNTTQSTTIRLVKAN